MMIKNRSAACALSVLAICGLSGAAGAAPIFTTVNNPPSGEASHDQILSQMYGGTWNKTVGGIDYSSGTMSAVRLADGGVATPTLLGTGVSGTDNAWIGGAATTITAQAKYAGDSSIFGYFDDTGSDQSFHSIFNTSSLNAPATVNMPASFRWALQDVSTGQTFTSRSTDNFGVGGSSGSTFDQLVTYQITGPGGANGWALFWEDRIMGQGSDYDYNDAAIMIRASQPNVPAPATAGVLGLAGIGLGARRRLA